MSYYPVMKKNEILSFAATWKDLEMVLLGEVKSERETQIYAITSMWSLKSMMHTKTIHKTESDSQT